MNFTTAIERQYEEERQERLRDQRIRIALRQRCSTTCVLPKGHDSQGHDSPHMRQDGTAVAA